MALKDVDSDAHRWFNYGTSLMPNSNNEETSQFLELGKGKELTKYMIETYNKKEGDSGYIAQQHSSDVWYIIQKSNVDLNTWYVPSRAEWSAFGDLCFKKLGLTKETYSNFGLSRSYWASSQRTAADAFVIGFHTGCVKYEYMYWLGHFVRLGSTF